MVPRVPMLMTVLLTAVEAAGPSSNIVLAIRDGRKLVDGAFQLDVASNSMMVGSDCSAGLPCWPSAGSSLLNVNDVSGVSLGSRDSLKLLRRQSYNVGTYQDLPSLRNGGVPPEAILYLLWALDPNSYFLGQRLARRIHALPTPTRRDAPCEGSETSVSTFCGRGTPNDAPPRSGLCL